MTLFQSVYLFVYVSFLLSFIYILSDNKQLEDVICDHLSKGHTTQQLCSIVNTHRFYERKRPVITKRMMNDKLYDMMSKKKVAKTNHRRPIWIKIP